MIFTLDVRRARKGDCLLLHFGTEDEPGLVMIDGGPSKVYQPHLKPRIEEIREARNVPDEKALPVDMLMVSHVDDDHIRGILEMTKEMIAAKNNNDPSLLKVFSLWHNSFDKTIGNQLEELTGSVSEQFGTASVSGDLKTGSTIESDDVWEGERPNEEVIVDTIKVLASVAQGSQLRDDAEVLGFPRNPEFDGKLILASDGGKKIGIGIDEDMEFTVVGPLLEEVKDLQKKHDKWLEDLEEKKKEEPEAALAAYVDESVANLASIVVLAEAGGKTMLLTGDARGDKVVTGLKHTGLLSDDPGSTLHVDVLKIPHHGSANNLETSFFELVTADHYVFSGDGVHGNPEREAFEMLFEARGDKPFTIHLTYPIDEMDEEREKDWNSLRQREINRNIKRVEKGQEEKPLRAEWSHDVHSIGALFDEHDFAGAGQKVEIVEADKPHLIELLDPLGF